MHNDTSVVIKGYKDGIMMILDPDMPFDELLERIRRKFEDSSKFLGSAKLALTFTGRKLDISEQKDILGVISEVSDLEILCVFDNDEDVQDVMKKTVDSVISSLSNQTGKFFYGSVGKGSHVETENSMVVIGNIERGGSVSCGGSLVVLGAILGSATAGTNGNREALIYASVIDAEHLQIVKTVYNSEGEDPKKAKKRLKAESKSHLDRAARLVTLKNDEIVITPVEEDTLRFDADISDLI
ncbi:MAG: septum site-determining protein MinC [Lachnospiraceae bacterium]|nr:septum site-determining protein MinC [Lachnospiraceae bacterium]